MRIEECKSKSDMIDENDNGFFEEITPNEGWCGVCQKSFSELMIFSCLDQDFWESKTL